VTSLHHHHHHQSTPDELARALDDQRVMTIAQWAQVNGFDDQSDRHARRRQSRLCPPRPSIDAGAARASPARRPSAGAAADARLSHRLGCHQRRRPGRGRAPHWPRTRTCGRGCGRARRIGSGTDGVGVRAGADRHGTAMATTTDTTKPAAKNRPVFIARFRALPDVDPIHALRLTIKQALRLHGLQCLSLEEEYNNATVQTARCSSDA
jgi:hypothetical protein